MAQTLRERGHDVTFVGREGGVEEQIVPDAGFSIRTIDVTYLPRSLGMGQVRSMGKAAKAVSSARTILRDVRPDVVLGGGGYVALPVAMAARTRRIPVVLTEADSHLGLANRIAGRWAERICTGFPINRFRSRQEVTGRPVDGVFATTTREAGRAALDVPEDALMVSAVGGSGGALNLNRAIADAWASESDLSIDGRPLVVMHVTGRRDYPQFRDGGAAAGYRVVEYCNTMPELIAASDLVISRAGGTVFELAVAGRPGLLVPWAGAAGDHQTRNAQHFVAHGAAHMVRDDDQLATSLRREVEALLSPSGSTELHGMAAAMSELARPDASQRIAEIVEQVGIGQSVQPDAAQVTS